ncbi:MAG: FimB/Mfa2 family fimbrial subunit [Bacteroidales bacterium]|nr:FimB/Mfa2 family fimbrial subunit [Bacteroidales bacterium]
MKRILLLIALVATLFSCSKDQQLSSQMVDVKVALTGIDIQVTPEDTRSTASEAGVKRIALSVYDLNGNLIQSATQNKDVDAANFGTPMTFRIPVGAYKFVAVAHTVAATTDPVATINSVTEFSLGSSLVGNPTFSTVQEGTISGNTTQTVTIDMGTRKNATFKAKFTDDNPSDVTKIQLIVSHASTAYSDLKVNPSTGLAAAQWKYEKTFDLSTLPITTVKNNSFSVPLMLTAASQTLDVTVNALSATDEVLYTRTLTDVPLQQGHLTQATGTFFSPIGTNTFSFDITEITDNISLD